MDINNDDNQNSILNIATISIMGNSTMELSYINNCRAKYGDIVAITLRNKNQYGICVDSKSINAGDCKKIIGISIEKIKPIQYIVKPSWLDSAYSNFLMKVAIYNMSAYAAIFKIAIPEQILHEDISQRYYIPDDAASRINAMPKKHQILYARLINISKKSNIIFADQIKIPKSSPDYINNAIELNILQKHDKDASNIILTDVDWHASVEQQTAVSQILNDIEDKFVTKLLFGQTGSGKTLIYLMAIHDILRKDPTKQALIMLPEINLIDELASQIEQYFKIKPLIWHSKISPTNKKHIIRHIIAGTEHIIIGTRSSALLPYNNLGIIVIDEEHDLSYKQSEHPVYHSRNMSIMRAKEFNFPVLLVSATPSIETYYNATRAQKYNIISVPSRVSGLIVPKVLLIDMRKEKMQPEQFISNPVRDAMLSTLEQGLQVILFLNRRGYSRMIICKECKYEFMCQYCHNHLSYHKNKSRLICHYCHNIQIFDNTCLNCNAQNTMSTRGSGVEKIQEEVTQFALKYKSIIASSDTMDHDSVMDNIVSGNIDIIIGTQIISKGYNFNDIGLVAVLDTSPTVGDMRSMERLYQMIIQMTGRAGRNNGLESMALIQTYQPYAPVLQAISTLDHHKFYNNEIDARDKADMPPFTHQIAIIISAIKEENARKGAEYVSQKLHYIVNAKCIKNDILILGPIQSPIYLLKSRYRYRILLQSTTRKALYIVSKSIIEQDNRLYDIKIDVDPYSFI